MSPLFFFASLGRLSIFDCVAGYASGHAHVEGIMKSAASGKLLRIIWILSALLSVKGHVLSQELRTLEDSMRVIHSRVTGASTQPERLQANEQFMNLMDEALRIDRKMEYPFDSLQGISRLVAPDKRFRLLSWFVPHQDGTFSYYGLIQSLNRRTKRYEVHWLQDRSGEIPNPETALLSADNWYGALYYELIPVVERGRTYYTLLGWDGNNPSVRRKLIEVMTLHENGLPSFGYYLFRNKTARERRVIFEYSSRASMTLRYDVQEYRELIRKKGRKTRSRPVVSDMIVFDRLVNIQPTLAPEAEFMVPETNVFDAYVFRNGRWTLYRDIDARNPEPTDPSTDRKPLEKGLLPPK